MATFISNDALLRNRINVDCSVTENVLSVSISVPKGNFSKELGLQLTNGFKEQIEKLVEVCTEKDDVIKTSTDYSDDELTEIELNELKDLFDWTDDYEQ